MRAFDEAGNELEPPLGQHPIGVILYEADRMIVAVGNGSSNVSREAAQRAFVSYTGSYTFDGELLVVRVDGASSPAFSVDQVRRISSQGPNRYVALPVSPEGQSSVLKFTWERVS